VREKALELRKEGTSIYVKAGTEANGRQRQLQRTLECYNEALRHSSLSPETPSLLLQETAITIANRSAAFVELKRYEEALVDIELALRLGYPSNLRWKVLLRKASILLAWGKFEGVLEVIDLIRNEPEIDMRGGLSNKLKDLAAKAAEGLQSLRVDKEDTIGRDKSQSPTENKICNRNPFEENPDFEYASTALKIQYDPARQRSVVTVKDLEVGDVLFREIPYASVLLPDFYPTHCHHCQADFLFALFP
jgi:tetratricopeptide (TPR) repeat protein